VPRQFAATILLDDIWSMDVEQIATAVQTRFPQIGTIEAVPGQADEAQSGILLIDGANVVLQDVAHPFPASELSPGLKVLKTWDAGQAIRTHKAHLTVTCGGDALKGVEGAKAYAAACHFVTAAAVTVSPARAVFWNSGWSLTQSEPFVLASELLLNSRMPLGTWVSFATIVPKGYAPEEATGMVTYGMRPFIGRELELAPRPGSPQSAYRCISWVARQILNNGLVLGEGQRLLEEETGVAMTVCPRTYWLRRDMSAFVLVSDDSVIDRKSLRPRTAEVS
jgi:hypothetical protein